MAKIPEKWFYAYVDLLRPVARPEDHTSFGHQEFRDDTLLRLTRAGYTAVVLSSYNLAAHLTPETAQPDAWNNLAKIVDCAIKLGIEIIPEMFPVGPSGSLLANDSNLAEPVPARNVNFKVVRNNDDDLVAIPVQNGLPLLADGDFRSCVGGTFDLEHSAWQGGWDDNIVAVECGPPPEGATGKALQLTFQPSESNAPDKWPVELGQGPFGVEPWHQYSLSWQVKIDQPDKEAPWKWYIAIRGDAGDGRWRRLTKTAVTLRDGSDWQKFTTSVNSFGCRRMDVWFGLQRSQGGTIHLADFHLEVADGINLLRREGPVTPAGEFGLPLEVRSADGETVYEEGRDFSRWELDYSEAPGHYFHDHRAGDLRIPAETSRIHQNDNLLVSYWHAGLPHHDAHRVCCNVRHPRIIELLACQAELVQQHAAPQRWLINHDEVWCLGYDPLAMGDSPARLLGENLRKCVEIIRNVSPQAGLYLTSDMYDPHHSALGEESAHSIYPMVNGSFCGSWDYIPEGLSIWNWRSAEYANLHEVEREIRASLIHFDRRSTGQVLGGFYDVTYRSEGSPDGDAAMVRQRAETLFRWAAEGGHCINGVCYYTMFRNLDFLDEFATAANEVWGD